MINKLKNFYKIYGNFYLKTWLLHLLVLVSLLSIDIFYFFVAIGVTLLYMPLQQLVLHEYISHEYITPKNKLIDLILLVMFFYAYGLNVKSKKQYHITHHKYWKLKTKDPTQQKMDGVPFWRYVLGFQTPKSQNLDAVDSQLLKNNQWVQLLEPHGTKILVAYNVLMFILLPIEWFVVFCIYLLWLIVILANIHDFIFHGIPSAKDYSWLVLIYGSAAWHLHHHENYNNHFHGPGLWKWANLAYYYQLIFFRENHLQTTK